LLTWIALTSDAYAEAVEYSEQAQVVAVTPQDRNTALDAKGCALVLLRQTDLGSKLLEEVRQRCVFDGDLYRLVGYDGAIGVCKVLQGNIREGIRFLEGAVSKREDEGYQATADWYRLFLCEIYLEIIGGKEKPPILTLLKNMPVLIELMITASSRVRAMVTQVLKNPQFDPEGYHIGHAQMILGLLFKIKKNRALALQHLTEAKRILSPFGRTPMLTRLDAALAELGQ